MPLFNPTTLQLAYDDSGDGTIIIDAGIGPVNIEDSAVPSGISLFTVSDNTPTILFDVAVSGITLDNVPAVSIDGSTIVDINSATEVEISAPTIDVDGATIVDVTAPTIDLNAATTIVADAPTIDITSTISTTLDGPLVSIGDQSSLVSAGATTIADFQDANSSVIWWPGSRTFSSAPGSIMRMTAGTVYTHDYPSVSFAALNLQAEMRHEQAGFLFNHGLIFNHGLSYRNVSGIAVNYGPIQGFIDQPDIAADAAAISMSLCRSFLSQPLFSGIGGGALTVTQFANFQAFGSLSTGATITTRRGLQIADLIGAGGTLTSQFGIDIDSLTRGATNVAIRMAQTGGTAIQHTGTAPSTFAGEIQMGNGVAVRYGAAGGASVNLLRSGAGVLRMIGTGGGNNEGLDWDFDAVANSIGVTTTTGAGWQMNVGAVSIGTTTAAPGSSNWQFALTPGAKTITIGGDFARALFTASANVTINAALSTFTTWTINSPGGTIGTGSVTDAANMLIQTAPGVGTNRYGLLITSNPAGGTANYALRVTNGNSRFDGRVDINNGVALGGGAGATLGTIGGAGPTAAAQAQWLEVDIAGTPHWIPVWT